jgi:hypothetical protein
MPTMPVRPTSTSPSSRISATKLSILSGVPVSSKMKLAGRGIDHLGAEHVAQAQRLDAVFASARHLDQRQFALDVRAELGEVVTLCTGTSRSSWAWIWSICAGGPWVTMVIRLTDGSR